jgi:hypothetical protein
MADARRYSRATVFALAALGGGWCYWPSPPCKTPVTVVVNGDPVANLQIAHIRAANPNGPRYDPNMTDDQRRHFSNVVLLCTPHHNVVDKIHPEYYPIATLEAWKRDRESGGIDRLNGLSELTEDRLQDIVNAATERSIAEIKEAIARVKVIDPDSAELLALAANRLAPDNTETLYEAAHLISKEI